MQKLERRIITEKLVEDSFIRELHLLERIGSTNDYLVSKVKKGQAGPGMLVAAEDQTAGKGRMGRSWTSPPGASLTFSFTCPNHFPARPGYLTLGTALALAEAVEKHAGIGTRIKWPNDVYTLEGKLAGILAQAVAVQPVPLVVVGIGLNVLKAPDHVCEPGTLPAVCLRDLTDTPLDRSLLLADILNEVDGLLRRFNQGETAFLVPALKKRSILLGARARLESNRKAYEGIVLDHTDDLGIILKTETGEITLPGETTTVVRFDSTP